MFRIRGPPLLCLLIESSAAATQYWHDLVASAARDFITSGVVFAIANEEDFLDDLR